jgi:acetyl esterase/lipase
VSDGVDHVRTLARAHPLDTTRVIAVGHSAGGHLALWAAARHRLPAASPLRRPALLRIAGAAALGPVMDLGEFAARAPRACGRGANLVVGGTPAEVPERHADGAPTGLLPLGIPHAIVVGELDPVLPAAPREAYVRRARQAGDEVDLLVIPGAAHFEVIAPESAAWPAVLERVRRLASRAR